MTIVRDTVTPQRAWPLLHEAVAMHARSRPRELAIDDGQRQLTYGEFHSSVLALTYALASLDTDRVGVLMGNVADHLEVLLAAPAANVTLAPLHEQWSAEQCREAARAFSLGCLVTDPTGARHLAEIDLDVPVVVLDDLRPKGVGDRKHVEMTGAPDPEAWHLIAPSGGTGGLLKGIVLSHRASAARALAQIVEFGIHANSTFVATTPLYHGAARGSSFAHLAAGGTVRLRPGFDPARFADDLEGATSTFCVPTMLVQLLEMGAGPLSPTLEILVSGASLDPQLARDARRRLGCTLRDYYASVDAGGLAVGAAGDGGADANLNGAGRVLGRPFFGAQLELDDETPYLVRKLLSVMMRAGARQCGQG